MNGMQNISEKGVIISAAGALSGKADFSREIFQYIEDDVTDNRHIFSRMIFPHPGVVFVKNCIQAPVKGILNSPVLSDCVSEAVKCLITRIIRSSPIDTAGRETGPRALRASFATQLLEEGAPFHVIGKALGHSDQAAVSHYVRVDVERLL